MGTVTVAAVNDPPTVSATSSSVTVDEGETAENGGNFDDIDAGDVVSVTASAGAVTQTGTQSGIWTWSLGTSDGPDDSQNVTITATDSAGAQATTSFSLTVLNVAPTLTNLSATSPIDEDGTSTLAGDLGDPGIDDLTLDVNWGDGSPVQTFNYPAGTTSFSETHQYLDDNPTGTLSDEYLISLTLTDSDGAQATEGGGGGGGASGLFWTEGPGETRPVGFATGGDKVRRANPDGTSPTDVVTGLRLSTGIDLADDGKLYFGDRLNPSGGARGNVYRVNTDGTGLETMVTNILRVNGVAVDTAAEDIYVATFVSSLQRYGFNGALEANLDRDSSDVALDLANGHIYTTNFRRNSVERMNLNGTGKVVLQSGLKRPRGIALDLEAEKIYFADDPSPFNDSFDGRIMRVNMDGTGFQVIVTGLNFPWGVALDGQGHVYWAERRGDRIARANLDGSGVETIINTDAPFDLIIGGTAGSELSVKVTVNNVPVEIVSMSLTGLSEGTPTNLTANFTDVGTLDTHTATVDFGAGAGAQPAAVAQGAGSGTVTSSNTYPDQGTFDVTVCVTDDDTASTCQTQTITVLNVAPSGVANAANVTVDEGTGAANSGTYSDPGDDNVSVSASIGAVTKTGTNNGTWSWSFGTDDGPSESQTVDITLDDGDGGVTVVSFSLTVLNIAPTANFDRPNNVNEGSSFNMGLSSQSDPSNADTSAGFTYAFDCGGGFGAYSGTPTAVCNTAVDDGPLSVGGKIKDKDGGETTYRR